MWRRYDILSDDYIQYFITWLTSLAQELAVKLDIVVEPTFIALGPFHIAGGINDRAWIYNIQEHGENCVDL